MGRGVLYLAKGAGAGSVEEEGAPAGPPLGVVLLVAGAAVPPLTLTSHHRPAPSPAALLEERGVRGGGGHTHGL